MGGMSNKIFTSKYKLQLPAPKVLETEIEHEKQRLLEMNIVKREKKKDLQYLNEPNSIYPTFGIKIFMLLNCQIRYIGVK